MFKKIAVLFLILAAFHFSVELYRANETRDLGAGGGKSATRAPVVAQVALESPPQAPPEPAPEPAPEPLPPIPSSLTVNFTGDVCFGSPNGAKHRWHPLFYKYGSPYFWQNLKATFASADATVINLENVFTDALTPYVGKIWTYKADPHFAEVLENSGITHASVVNNHMHDYLQEGLTDTLSILDRMGITPFGYHMSNQKSAEVGDGVQVDRRVIIEKNGIKIGILGYLGFQKVYISQSEVEAHVQAFKDQGVDAVVVSVHWGGQNTKEIMDYQRVYGRMFIDAGCDLVIGNHPHTLQQMETYKGKRIYYALGDLLFVHKATVTDTLGLIVQLKVKKHPDGSLTLTHKHIPVAYASNIKYNDFKPRLVTNPTERMLIDDMLAGRFVNIVTSPENK